MQTLMLNSRLLLQQRPLGQLLAAGANFCVQLLQQTCSQPFKNSRAFVAANDAVTTPASSGAPGGSAVHEQQRTRITNVTNQQHQICFRQQSSYSNSGLYCCSRCWTPASTATLGFRAYAAGAADAASGDEEIDSASEEAREITRSLRDAQTLQQLTEMVQQSLGRLQPIHVSAALITTVKLAKSAADGQAAVDQLLQLLTSSWDSFLQQAGLREISNCLWACAKLGYKHEQLWRSSLDAVIPCISNEASVRDLTSITHSLGLLPQDKDAAVACLDKAQVSELLDGVTRVLLMSDQVTPRLASDMLWSAAKLALLPAPGIIEALLLKLSKHTQPAETSCSQPGDGSSQQDTAKYIAIALWALGELQQLPQAGVLVSQNSWHEVLSPEKLATLAAGGCFAVASSLAALGRLCTAQQHTLPVPFAQECAKQLLRGPTALDIGQWSAVDIGHALHGCGMMGVKDTHFLQSVAAAAPQWLPAASAYQIQMVAGALGKLKFKDPQLMAALANRGKQLLPGNLVHAPLAIKVHLATQLTGAVAALNVQELAADVKELLYSSAIKHWKGPLPPYAAVTLWRVHTWLVHQHLMGGHGLTRLLTEQQLAACAAATRHTHRVTPQRDSSAGTKEHDAGGRSSVVMPVQKSAVIDVQRASDSSKRTAQV